MLTSWSTDSYFPRSIHSDKSCPGASAASGACVHAFVYSKSTELNKAMNLCCFFLCETECITLITKEVDYDGNHKCSRPILFSRRTHTTLKRSVLTDVSKHKAWSLCELSHPACMVSWPRGSPVNCCRLTSKDKQPQLNEFRIVIS